jgi:hypothetical protein
MLRGNLLKVEAVIPSGAAPIIFALGDKNSKHQREPLRCLTREGIIEEGYI